MTSSSARTRSRLGFTLIELSIAITLAVLIAMTLYGAFYLGQRAVAKTQDRSDEGQRLRSVSDLLAEYLRSAYPYRLSPQDPAIYFVGKEDRLEFVSALSSGMGGRGMSRVAVAWREEADGAGALFLVEQIPARFDRDEGEGYTNSVVLSRGIKEFGIEYLEPQSQGEEEHWVDRWDGSERRQLPRAVRLHYLGRQGAEIQWLFPIMMSVLSP